MATRFPVEDDLPIRVTPRRVSVRWPWLLVAAAWLVALLATLTGQRSLLDHHFLLEESGLPWPVAAAVFLACWQVMLGAMMLPASMPTVAALLRTSHAQAHRWRARAAFLAGYGALWTGFALVAFVGDTLIHRTVDAWPWLEAHAFLIGAATLAGAGAFQFTSLKRRCLIICHNPQAFFARFYHAGTSPAWWLGVRHGIYSVGCCWGMMLVMFGLGVGGLGWMALLTAVMLIEAIHPGERQIRPALGVALLVLALLWLAHPTWLVPAGLS